MKYTFTILSIFLLVSCNQTTKVKKTELDIKSELESIEAFHNEYQAAIREGRLDDLDNFYSKNSKVVMPGGTDFEKLARIEKERGVIVAYDSLFINIEETQILNDSTAYDWGTSTIYYTDNDSLSVKIEDSFFVLLKKENGEWKIYREMSSSVVN